MLNIDTTRSIFHDIQNIKPSTQQMHNYVNSLSKEYYTVLATVFELGRTGWERDYYDTNKYIEFMEDMAADGVEVTQKMLDDTFLPKKLRQKQIDDMYHFKLVDAIKHDGVYSHNWLSLKTNLISAASDGISMLHEAI